MESAKQNGSRPSLKSNSPFNKYPLWKHKLRDNCYKRVRDDRTRLLWKFRCNQHHDFVKSAFQDIVSDEFNKIKHTDELLWDYDGPPDTDSTYKGECQDILLEMQRIFYQDLNSQPPIQDLQSDIEAWEDEVDEYLARAVYEHMQLNADEANGKEIWCPICKQGELKDSPNLIYCTRCELKLNKDSEVLIFPLVFMTLDFLAFGEHEDGVFIYF